MHIILRERLFKLFQWLWSNIFRIIRKSCRFDCALLMVVDGSCTNDEIVVASIRVSKELNLEARMKRCFFLSFFYFFIIYVLLLCCMKSHFEFEKKITLSNYSRRVTHQYVVEVLNRLCSTEETFLPNFLVILKRMFQNY